MSASISSTSSASPSSSSTSSTRKRVPGSHDESCAAVTGVSRSAAFGQHIQTITLAAPEAAAYGRETGPTEVAFYSTPV
ncbi:hypothetical protein GCM10027258_78370 [Amycolatopsis stemonae]